MSPYRLLATDPCESEILWNGIRPKAMHLDPSYRMLVASLTPLSRIDFDGVRTIEILERVDIGMCTDITELRNLAHKPTTSNNAVILAEYKIVPQLDHSYVVHTQQTSISAKLLSECLPIAMMDYCAAAKLTPVTTL